MVDVQLEVGWWTVEDREEVKSDRGSETRHTLVQAAGLFHFTLPSLPQCIGWGKSGGRWTVRANGKLPLGSSRNKVVSSQTRETFNAPIFPMQSGGGKASIETFDERHLLGNMLVGSFFFLSLSLPVPLLLKQVLFLAPAHQRSLLFVLIVGNVRTRTVRMVAAC